MPPPHRLPPSYKSQQPPPHESGTLVSMSDFGLLARLGFRFMDIDSGESDAETWPETKRDVERAPSRPAPALCHTLAPKDTPGTWRGQHLEDSQVVDASSFLQKWARISDRPFDDLTESDMFLWGFYVWRWTTPFDVIGPGINKFFIADVPGVSDPDCPTRNQAAFFARRSDGSLVRIQPYSSQGPRLLCVDRPGPDYYGHVARYSSPGSDLAPGGSYRAIANAEGLQKSSTQ